MIHKFLLAAVCITIFPVLLLYFPQYFESRFASLGVYDAFVSKDTWELNRQFGTVLEYLRPFSTTILDPNFYASEDLLHMADVRVIFSYWYLLILLIVLLTLFGRRIKVSPLTKKLLIVSVATAFSVVLLWAILDFSSLFTTFHKVLFPYNEYWLLDPATSNLIKFLPTQIFVEIFGVWLLLSGLLAALLGYKSYRFERSRLANPT